MNKHEIICNNIPAMFIYHDSRKILPICYYNILFDEASNAYYQN